MSETDVLIFGLVAAGFTIQLIVAFKTGKIFAPPIVNAERGSQPILFWFAVVMDAALVLVGVWIVAEYWFKL